MRSLFVSVYNFWTSVILLTLERSLKLCYHISTPLSEREIDVKRWCCMLLAVLSVFSLCMPLISSADTMTASEDCIKFIKQREGFSKYPYWDNSQWTVGYGTRVPEGKLEEYQKNGISEEEALELLASMMKDFEKSIHRYIEKYELTLTQQQFDALVSFTFNCGAAWTTDANGYLNTAVREGWTGSKFLHAMCLWSRSGGDFILMKRRWAETNIYMNANYGSNSAIPDNYRCVYLDGNGGEVRYIPHGFDATDQIPIIYSFKKKPTGIDDKGNAFTYEFLGWYTADGRKVEVLDETVESGTVLYAQWVDAAGNTPVLSKGTKINAVNVTIQDTVNVRTGPGTFYPSVEKLSKDTKVTITEIYEYGGREWGKCAKGWLSLSYTDYEEVTKIPEEWPKTGTVSATHVNVRKGPGLDFDRVYQLTTGDKVTISEKQAADGLDWGKMEDGNWICLAYVRFENEPQEPVEPPVTEPEDPDEPPDEMPDEPTEPEPTEPPAIPGDVNGDETVTKDDAIYLLRYVLFTDKYPLEADGDIDVDGDVDKDDAIYLLRHVLFPEKYPLNTPKEET